MALAERLLRTSSEIRAPYPTDILPVLRRELPKKIDGYTFESSSSRNVKPGEQHTIIDIAPLTPSFDIKGLKSTLLGFFTPEPTRKREPREIFASPGWQLPVITFDYENSGVGSPTKGTVDIRLFPDTRYLNLIRIIARAGFSADHLRSFISKAHLEALQTEGGWKLDKVLKALVRQELKIKNTRGTPQNP